MRPDFQVREDMDLSHYFSKSHLGTSVSLHAEGNGMSKLYEDMDAREGPERK